MTNSFCRAIASSLIRLYPRAWRARYEAELRSLLDESGVTLAALGDLAWSVGVERLRTTLGWRPRERTALTLGGLADLVVFGLLGGLAATLSLVVADRIAPIRLGLPSAVLPIALTGYLLTCLRPIPVFLAQRHAAVARRLAVG